MTDHDISGERILVVEDEPATRLGLTELVRTWGFTADAAADARKTVRLVQPLTQSPDHPILPAVPETEYLRGFLLQVMA